MFISLIGLPLTGKDEIAQWLVKHRGFTRVHIRRQQQGDSSSALSSASSPKPNEFSSAASLLSHATTSWQSHMVTTDLHTAEDLEGFLKRPFFLLIGTEASGVIRWDRSIKRAGSPDAESFPALRAFLQEQDDLLYTPEVSPKPPFSAPSSSAASSTSTPLSTSLSTLSLSPQAEPQLPTPLHSLLGLAALRIVNNFPSLDRLHQHLAELNLEDTERVRPSWDNYFMTLASLASLRSNCMKRRVGAILVREKRIVSTGYNGTPRGMRNCNEGGCTRCNRGEERGGGLHLCVCLHAEENALLEAGRERVGTNATLYCNTCPCLSCAVKIVQSGVKEVVYNLAYAMDDASARVLSEGGVALRRLRPAGVGSVVEHAVEAGAPLAYGG